MTRLKKTYNKAVTQEGFLYKKNISLDEEYNKAFSKPLDESENRILCFNGFENNENLK